MLSPQAQVQQRMGKMDGLHKIVDDLYKAHKEMGEQMEAVVRCLDLLKVRGQGVMGGNSSIPSQSSSSRQLEANL